VDEGDEDFALTRQQSPSRDALSVQSDEDLIQLS